MQRTLYLVTGQKGNKMKNKIEEILSEEISIEEMKEGELSTNYAEWGKAVDRLDTLIQEEVEEFARTSTAYNKGKRALMKEAKEYINE